jgi:hypothetical protein
MMAGCRQMIQKKGEMVMEIFETRVDDNDGRGDVCVPKQIMMHFACIDNGKGQMDADGLPGTKFQGESNKVDMGGRAAMLTLGVAARGALWCHESETRRSFVVSVVGS